jgi:hypothetical protein
MALKNKPHEEAWRREFLDSVGDQLLCSFRGRMGEPHEIGTKVEKHVGFPAELWVKISAEAWPRVTGVELQGHCFRAGMVVGWVEARKRFDKKWGKGKK